MQLFVIIPIYLILFSILYLILLSSFIAFMIVSFVIMLVLFYKKKVYRIKNDKIYFFSIFQGFNSLSIKEVSAIDMNLNSYKILNTIIISFANNKKAAFYGGDLRNTKKILKYLTDSNLSMKISPNVFYKLKEGST